MCVGGEGCARARMHACECACGTHVKVCLGVKSQDHAYSTGIIIAQGFVLASQALGASAWKLQPVAVDFSLHVVMSTTHLLLLDLISA